MGRRWNWEFPEYPSDWDEIRRTVLRRDGGRCQECGTRQHPLHVHHIVSLSRGGSDDPSNLVTLCEDCHSQYHSHMGGAGRSRRVPSTRPTFYPQLGRALTTYDGNLIVGGNFTSVNGGGVAANRIAAWDGATWSALGDGLDGQVFALAEFDGDLYAGESFSNAGGVAARYIAKWSGAVWSAVG